LSYYIGLMPDDSSDSNRLVLEHDEDAELFSRVQQSMIELQDDLPLLMPSRDQFIAISTTEEPQEEEQQEAMMQDEETEEAASPADHSRPQESSVPQEHNKEEITAEKYPRRGVKRKAEMQSEASTSLCALSVNTSELDALLAEERTRQQKFAKMIDMFSSVGSFYSDMELIHESVDQRDITYEWQAEGDEDEQMHLVSASVVAAP
jgi:hypothetical protein